MEFIDVNCMIGEWHFENLRFKSAQELSDEMERIGIKKALVFHSRSWQYEPVNGNEAIVNETRGCDDLLPVITLNPLIKQEFGGRENLVEFIKTNRIAAARLFPIDHNYTLELWNIEEMMSIMSEIRMPVLIDIRNIDGTLDRYYPQIYNVAKSYPDVPLVLLTVGYRTLRILYPIFERCPNVHIDTSTFINFRGIEDVVKNFSSEIMLFGTRMPFIEGGAQVGRVLYADISEEDKENIACRNAIRLLKGHKLLNFNEKEEAK